jgi:hypothetical protein
MPLPRRTALLACALLTVLAPARARAQDADGWNDPAALDLIARARDLRQSVAGDPGLTSYQANATGRVFFLVDRPDTDRRTLVKADQIAIEVFWRAPRATRQRIVGQRDEEVLPTNIRYHLDHLTVVQDDFGDLIRLGDGDEVEAVVHPAAPLAEVFYDFRMGDSLTIAFPGTDLTVRVNEVQVRPKRMDLPGFVGSVFLDRSNSAIVRMTFTFTPASYVDRYLDYIRISLDNSLWEGKWWLPFRQEAEIRREMPALDFLAGSIIRGSFEITDYAFNTELPANLFSGPVVTAVPEAERESFVFQEPLIPEEEAEELTPTPTLAEIRAQALELTAGRYLSGLAKLRLHAPTASHVFRWNRGEGSFVGAGFAWRPDGERVFKARGGWAFGADQPSVALALENADGRIGVAASWNELRDLGPFPGQIGMLNTISALASSVDATDPWFSRGITVFARGVSLALERHDSARTVLDAEDAADFRPLPTVEEGELGMFQLQRGDAFPGPLAVDMTVRGGWFYPDGGAETRVLGAVLGALSWEHVPVGSGPSLTARMDVGIAFGDSVPPQQLFYLGGRGTLPGHAYRAQVGDQFWLARAGARVPVFAPWLSLSAFAAAGAVADGATRVSVGPGVGLGWDVIQVELGRGLDGGEWEWVVSVDRRFRGWL